MSSENEHSSGNSPSGFIFPARPVTWITAPFVRFLHIESASGLVLLACTILALAIANSPLGAGYQAFWDTKFTIGVDAFSLSYPLWYWINDGLMAIFFFVVGLEIKREMVAGELSDPKNVALPIAAACGGAAVPAVIYAMQQSSGPAASGWAVPMATDIAFVVGALSLLGPRVPHGLKILMLALAIVDDILAVLVIAFFYTGHMSVGWLLGAVAGFGVIYTLNRLGVRTVAAYVVVGAGIWLCALKSGVHPTVAGVLLGLLTPASAWLGQDSLESVLHQTWNRLRTGGLTARQTNLVSLSLATRESVSPLERLEHALHPWVGFFIMPIFALANAAVAFEADTLTSPVAVAVASGLIFGKPIGIVLASWLVYRIGLARLPTGVSWSVLAAGGALGGIGFTMALFIAGLGLSGDSLQAAKGGVLMGSLISAVLGSALLVWLLPKPVGQEQGSPLVQPGE